MTRVARRAHSRVDAPDPVLVPPAPARRRTILGLLRFAAAMSVYHIVFAVFAVVYGPLMLWRVVTKPNYRTGFLERTGRVARSPNGRRVVWVHGVSVGEVKAAATIVEQLRSEYPELDLVVSATTPTGNALARQLYPDLRVIYFPLDVAHFPWRALRRVRPDLVVLMELEIWPNFLEAAAHREIPVIVANGRMSERSFKQYRILRGLMPQFGMIRLYCVQNETYRRRLRELAVDDERLIVTGNTKYDSVALRSPSEAASRLRRWLAPDGELVLVCGSTHGDEDRWVVGAAREAADSLGRRVRVVTVPRHPPRAPAVRDALAADGIDCVAWSRVGESLTPLGARDVVLVDTIGQLEDFYGACDVAFVGGSLVPRGGQNMIEPAALGRAVIFGPHVENFRKDVQNLMRVDAAVRTRGRETLAADLARLLDDAELREQLGQRAVELIRQSQGATERTVARLRPLLDPLFAAPAAP